jgi:tRNA pseudouridine38-40 synthase
VVHFDTAWPIPVNNVVRALNGVLPDDLTVRDAQIAEEGFHARFSATARTYRYVILNRDTPSAMLGRYAWQVRDPLDTAAMRTAARELIGSHDFATFGQPDTSGKSTVRVVERIAIEAYRPGLLRITVRGNAFLRQQVRAFIGTLHLAGVGKLTATEIAAIRDSRDRTKCPPVAPARGLTLVHVDYSGIRLTRPRPLPDGTEEDEIREDGNE